MDNLIKPFLELMAFIHQFLTKDLWHLDFTKISRLKAFFYRQILVSYLVARAFIQDRLLVRASALVYATLLSIVPLLAVMFSLLKGFGFHNRLEPTLYQIMAPLGQQAMDLVIPNIVNFVDNVDVSALGAAGLLLLLFSVLSIINNIERAFNDIWKVHRVRSLQRRFSDYLSVLLLGPLLLFTILGITASLQSFTLVEMIQKMPVVSFIVNKTAPTVTSWVAFYFLITFIPNTRVRIRSALIGAILSGTLWQFANIFFARFIVASYQTGAKAALYAGFATLPLFLVWLFISWAIVLLGAEIAYAHQNANKISWEIRGTHYSQQFKEAITIQILVLVGEPFHYAKPAPSMKDLTDVLNVPERLINEILTDLIAQRFIYAIDDDITRYTPAVSLENMKIIDVIQKLQKHGISFSTFDTDYNIGKTVEEFQKQMEETLRTTFSNTSLKDLLKKSDS